jgi:hypothetical protein
VQRSLDECWGDGLFNDWRGRYLEVSAEVIRIFMDHVERLNSPWTDIKIAHLEGAVSRVPESATSYGSRNARFALVIQARWKHGLDSTAQLAWANRLRDALASYSTAGSTPISLPLTRQSRVPFGSRRANYRRLRELK